MHIFSHSGHSARRCLGATLLAAVFAAGTCLTSFAAVGTYGNTVSMAKAGTTTLTGKTGTAVIDTSVAKPDIDSEGAALYDATDGVFLYERNGSTQYYPASITKVMTCLLAAENLSPEQQVTFSSSAVDNLESGAVTLDIVAGDTFQVKDLLYGLWLKSANEVANGLAEAVSGSVSAFADRMNARAAAIGCTNTHFANPNGLNNSSHRTTPHDMALITAEAFNNATVREVAKTLHYNFPATASCPEGHYLTMGHKMLNPSNPYYYANFIGGKTGYTSKALNTLTSVAEKNGIRLVAVVMKSSGTHYKDTKALFDYGFAALSSSSAKGTSSGSTGTGPSSDSSASSGTAGSSSDRSASSGTVSPTSPANASETGTAKGPGASGSAGGTATAALTGTWSLKNGQWIFRKTDGSYAASGVYEINGAEYAFDASGIMLTGWQLLDGKWYYFSTTTGAMRKNYWVRSAAVSTRWYYLGADGVMLTNATTPDGYRVDSGGAFNEAS